MVDYTDSINRLRGKYDFSEFGDEKWKKIPNTNNDKIRWTACALDISIEEARKLVSFGHSELRDNSQVQREDRNKKIIKMRSKNMTYKQIAAKTGLTESYVGYIIRNALTKI